MPTLRSKRTTASIPQQASSCAIFKGRVTKPGCTTRTARKPKVIPSPPSPTPTIITSESDSEQTIADSSAPLQGPQSQFNHPLPCANTSSSSAPFLPHIPHARSAEYSRINSLLTTALQPSNPSTSLYICGTPGTGKTLTVTSVTTALQTIQTAPPRIITLNCAHLRNPKQLFSTIASALSLPIRRTDAHSAIRSFATSPGPKVVLVLDEVDFLASRDQLVLYAAFEWPHLCHSRIITVGVANAIDLPLRLLPWLRANGCMPHIIPFAPYDSQALHAIVGMHCGGDEEILTDTAVSLAAKKVAAGSGDARLVLDVCRETVKRVRDNEGSAVAVVAKVMQRRGGGSRALEVIRELPVQQQLALCVAANTVAFGGKKRATMEQMYESFERMCERARVGGVAFDDFVDICSGALVHHGLVEVSQGKRGRGRKGRGIGEKTVVLTIPVEDVREGLEGRAFLPLLIAR